MPADHWMLRKPSLAMLSFPPPKFMIGQKTGLPSRRGKEANLGFDFEDQTRFSKLVLIVGRRRGVIRPNGRLRLKEKRGEIVELPAHNAINSRRDTCVTVAG